MLGLFRNNKIYLANLFLRYYNTLDLKILDNIKKYIKLVYESKFCDVKDIADCVFVINHFIKRHLINNKPCVPLINLRQETNQMVKIKYYQGHDLLYQKEISDNLVRPKLEFGITPVQYKNYFECKEEYRLYKKIIWKPTTQKLLNNGILINL